MPFGALSTPPEPVNPPLAQAWRIGGLSDYPESPPDAPAACIGQPASAALEREVSLSPPSTITGEPAQDSPDAGTPPSPPPPPTLPGRPSVGIGVTLRARAGGVGMEIGWVEPGSNALRSGVLAGTELLCIDGVSVASMDVEQAQALLLGPPHSAVVLCLRVAPVVTRPLDQVAGTLDVAIIRSQPDVYALKGYAACRDSRYSRPTFQLPQPGSDLFSGPESGGDFLWASLREQVSLSDPARQNPAHAPGGGWAPSPSLSLAGGRAQEQDPHWQMSQPQPVPLSASKAPSLLKPPLGLPPPRGKSATAKPSARVGKLDAWLKHLERSSLSKMERVKRAPGATGGAGGTDEQASEDCSAPDDAGKESAPGDFGFRLVFPAKDEPLKSKNKSLLPHQGCEGCARVGDLSWEGNARRSGKIARGDLLVGVDGIDMQDKSEETVALALEEAGARAVFEFLDGRTAVRRKVVLFREVRGREEMMLQKMLILRGEAGSLQFSTPDQFRAQANTLLETDPLKCPCKYVGSRLP